MNTLTTKSLRFSQVILTLSLVAGCVSGNTPTEKLHSRLRAKPVPISNYLPNHELLVKQPNHFPFHYFYLKDNVRTYKYVHIAPVSLDEAKKSEKWAKLEKMFGQKVIERANDLAAFTRKAYEQAFRNHAKENAGCLEVTDRTDLPDTLIVEPAIIAAAPTKAELNVVGTAASFFVIGTDIIASALSAGSITMECIVRDAATREIIAMYANTETDPNALLPAAGFSHTAPVRINVKEMARQTARVLAAKDYREIRRKFPIQFASRIIDAKLDKEPAEKK